MGAEGRSSYLMHALGGTHQWKAGFDLSYIPFEGDNIGSPLGSWTFPKDAPYNADRSDDFPDAVHQLAPDLREHSGQDFAPYVQDDWQVGAGLTLNLGLRYDVQFGSFNEDVPDLLSTIDDKLGRDVLRSRCRCRRSLQAPDGPRRQQQLRAARRRGVGSGRRRQHEYPRRLRVVLRQHAHAAELRRAHLAAERSRS